MSNREPWESRAKGREPWDARSQRRAEREPWEDQRESDRGGLWVVVLCLFVLTYLGLQLAAGFSAGRL